MSRRALVLGAGGFLGSHVCRGLLAAGWRVSGVARHAAAGPARRRLAQILPDIRLVHGDATDAALLAREVRGVDAVFPFAGSSGAASSMASPFDDLASSARSQLALLESLRRHNPDARVVFPGSRLQYGRPRWLPVDERHPMEPTSMYGIHKLSAEQYCRVYHEHYLIPVTCLRISSPYGPHQGRPDRAFGIVGTFLGIAAADGAIGLYGGGRQLRDYVYVDDLVRLVLLAATEPAAVGRAYNAGGPEPVTLRSMAEAVVRTVGRGSVTEIDWPSREAAVETGDYIGDLSRVQAELGWQPTTSLEDGLDASWAAMSGSAALARLG